MALTPDDIERRTFPIADWGYDRGDVHKFLSEVAAVVRYAQHQQVVAIAPPIPPAPPADGVTIDLTGELATRTEAPPEAAEVPPLVGPGDYALLGDQVAEVLRAADAVAGGLRSRAEADTAEIRARAEVELADRTRAADEEVAEARAEALRLLRTAKEQANAIVADASAKAEEILATAVERADQHTVQAEVEARRHAERLVRFERDVHARLRAARHDVDRALERLAGSEDHPVLDLTEDEAQVRTGHIGDEPGADERLPVLRRGDLSPAEAARPARPGADDPLGHLVRSAVGLAVEASARQG